MSGLNSPTSFVGISILSNLILVAVKYAIMFFVIKFAVKAAIKETKKEM